MELQVRIRRNECPEGLCSYATRRIRLALGRFGECVRRVRVGLSRTKDSRGLVESSCRVTAVVPRTKRIEVLEVDANPYVAIDRATERISRKCNRALDELRLGGARTASTSVSKQTLANRGRTEERGGREWPHP